MHKSLAEMLEERISSIEEALTQIEQQRNAQALGRGDLSGSVADPLIAQQTGVVPERPYRPRAVLLTHRLQRWDCRKV